MEPADAIITEGKAKKRRGLIFALALALIVNLPLLFVLGGISFTVGIAVGVYTYIRVTQGRYIVIWFRRFSSENEKKARFRWLLRQSLRQLGVAVTLQDSVFRYAYLRNPGWLILTYIIFAKLAIICSVAAAVLIMMLIPGSEPPSGSPYVFGGLSLLILAPLSYLIVRFLQRTGYIRLREKTWLKSLERSLNSIVDRKGAHYGVNVFKCEDGFWKDAVRRALGSANVAIIDVNELSDNLAWEIKTVSQTLPLGSIILTYSSDQQGGGNLLSAASSGLLPEEIRRAIEAKTNIPHLETCRVFHYDSQLVPVGPRRGRYVRDKSSELRSLVIGGIAESRRQ